MGNFPGFKGPDQVQHGSVSADGIDAAARAAQNLRNTGMQVVAGFMSDQKQESDALARARAGNAVPTVRFRSRR